MKRFVAAAFLMFAIALPTQAQDLSAFTVEDFYTNVGDPTTSSFTTASYSILGNGDLDIPSVNNNHFVLLSPTNAITNTGDVFTMSVAIDNQADDDYIGWVFGFDTNDSKPSVGSSPKNNSADYVLVHWKAAAQGTPSDFGGPLSNLVPDNGAGVSGGMYAARIQGIPSFDEFWFRKDSANTPGTYTSIGTATGAGAADYRGFTNTCAFLRYADDRVVIYAQGEKVLDTTTGAPYPTGKWGLYFAAQQQVRLRVGKALCFGDADFDGIVDTADLDDDNDGIPDLEESGGLSVGDTNGNALPDWADSTMPGFVDANADRIDDRYDFDLDGIPNHLDVDSDGDGVLDLVEGNDTNHDGANDKSGVVDANGDGAIDTITDANSNGLDDRYESVPASLPNRDASAGADYLDADDDGDGVLTSAECPMPSACVDHDGDGVPDYLDLCGDTHITGTEACDDGNDDADDGCAASCLLEAGEACTTNGECDLGRCDTGSSSVCVVCFDDHADTTTDDGCGGAAKFCNTAPAGHACVECFDASLCDDTNDCTDDACAAGACTHTNNSDACDDGDLCTTADTCAGGACAGSAVNCDDGLGCTTEMCNGATGSCAVSVGTGCAIEGACWTAGATKPGNTCLECNTALSTVHWSVATGCTGCTSDADCSGATGVCDTGSGVCVQCLAGKTTACVGASPICSLAAAVCSACVSDAECQARDSSAPVCAGSGACVECTSNAQCNDDALCAVASGTCIPFDFDGDGINDADDADSDNDGILDVDEGHGVDPSADTDHDGVPDYLDEDHAGFVDENGDGVDDRFDTDGDGHPDHLDLDADGDGIPDIVEAGGVDADGDGRVDDDTDADVDGLADLVDPSEGGTPWTLPDTDGDGKKDFQDTDSDNDGISDLVEAHDFDGDGKADVVPENNDTDGDGWDDAFDGAGLDAPPDSDGDGKPNYQDVDDDGDGVLTKDERTDSNGNGIPDYLEGDVHGGDVDAGDDAGVDGGSPQTGSLAGGALCTTQAGTRNPGAPALLLVMATCLGLARRRRRP